MSEEEKEAIEIFKKYNIAETLEDDMGNEMDIYHNELKTIIVNLIEKQQKEIEQFENKVDNLVEEQIEKQKYLTTLEEKCEKQQKEIEDIKADRDYYKEMYYKIAFPEEEIRVKGLGVD